MRWHRRAHRAGAAAAARSASTWMNRTRRWRRCAPTSTPVGADGRVEAIVMNARLRRHGEGIRASPAQRSGQRNARRTSALVGAGSSRRRRGAAARRARFHPPHVADWPAALVEQLADLIRIAAVRRQASVLRLGRACSVLNPDIALELRDRAVGHRGRRSGRDPVGQHRLHRPSAKRHRHAGAALGRSGGRTAAAAEAGAASIASAVSRSRPAQNMAPARTGMAAGRRSTTASPCPRAFLASPNTIMVRSM